MNRCHCNSRTTDETRPAQIGAVIWTAVTSTVTLVKESGNVDE
jgi:hypothetical protein